MTRETKTAVNRFQSMPMIIVRAKPLTSSVPTHHNTRLESSCVTCESKIVTQARLNPLRIWCARLAPRSFSSRMRSKTSTLASTAMPIVSARPARPGSEKVDCMNAIEPISRIIFSSSATTATTPANR